MENAFTSFVMPLLGVVFVILLAYVGTGWLAKKYVGTGAGKNMRVIERLSLGQDKSLLLVRVGGKTLLLGVSGKGFEVLRELDADELPVVEEAPAPKNDFADMLAAAMKVSPLMEKLREKLGGKEGKP